MGLSDYHRKRNFRRTPEPKGAMGRAGERRIFVVHEHHATRLHFDVRLEMGGVLASWAVPKGPSLDPAEKRLAVHVEDHPLAYASFKGVIPEGGYGAGRVHIWDEGTWSPDGGDPVAAVKAGRLKFHLAGSKLRGGFMLVRMGGRAATGPKENWLLIKERDEEARAGDVAQTIERPSKTPPAATRTRGSASTRRARVARPAPKPPSRAPAPSAASRRTSTRPRRATGGPTRVEPGSEPPPAFVEPQLATLVAAAPEGEGWLHEIKLDGYRILCRIEDGEVRLLTRSGLDWSRRFPALVARAATLPVRDALLDGEVVVLDEHGVSSFGALQDALSAERTDDVTFFVFDLLHLDGRPMGDLPLIERKARLAALLGAPRKKAGEGARGRGGGGAIRYLDHVEGVGTPFLRAACDHALEGILSKRAAAPRRAGRGTDWVKAKCAMREELVVAGFTEPSGARAGLGALVLGTHDAAGRLVYAGRVGTGFSESSLRSLRARLEPLETKRRPFDRLPASAETRDVHWVRPELVAQVTFLAWTRDGIVRHATFDGLREDKAAADVVRDRPRALGASAGRARTRPTEPVAPTARPRGPATSRAARTTSAGSRSEPAPGATRRVAGDETIADVRISHPTRLVYAAPPVTKADLARYYEAVAEHALPHLSGRPLSLVRCPEGEGKPCFFQKHAEPGPHLRSVSVSDDASEPPYVAVDDASGLAALVQRGVLEIHPWGSRVGALEAPDVLTIDLDPADGVSWAKVVDAAHRVRDELTALGLRGFPKTTGGKGLHVVVPLSPGATWDDVKRLSKGIAERLVAERPDLHVAKTSKALRAGRILIDWLRNMRGATAVGAFSTRARPGATVATPIAWDELSKDLRAEPFDVRSVPRRLARLRRDPWAGFFTTKQTISAATWARLAERARG